MRAAARTRARMRCPSLRACIAQELRMRVVDALLPEMNVLTHNLTSAVRLVSRNLLLFHARAKSRRRLLRSDKPRYTSSGSNIEMKVFPRDRLVLVLLTNLSWTLICLHDLKDNKLRAVHLGTLPCQILTNPRD